MSFFKQFLIGDNFPSTLKGELETKTPSGDPSFTQNRDYLEMIALEPYDPQVCLCWFAFYILKFLIFVKLTYF